MENAYCMGCMRTRPPDEAVCPVCGYEHAASANPEFALPTGTRLLGGKYLIGKVLGRGGFGITYLGLDTTLGLKVAVKECFPANMVSRVMDTHDLTWQPTVVNVASIQRIFTNEARKIARMEDVTGIVKVREVFEENNTEYIVMGYIEGETLRDRLRRTGPMDPENCLRLLWPVMTALSTAHRMGMIHRDISPDNIMIRSSDWSVWLLDLGAAKDMGGGIAGLNVAQSTHLIVRNGYSPWEQYSKKEEIGPWTDVYALCATAYCCMTGKSPPPVMDRAGQDEIAIPETVPAPVAAVLRKGLSLFGRNRQQSMRELLMEFDAAVRMWKQGGSGNRYPLSRSENHHPKSRPGKWLAAVLVLVLLAGGGGGAFWWYTQEGGGTSSSTRSAGKSIRRSADPEEEMGSDPEEVVVVSDSEEGVASGLSGSAASGYMDGEQTDSGILTASREAAGEAEVGSSFDERAGFQDEGEQGAQPAQQETGAEEEDAGSADESYLVPAMTDKPSNYQTATEEARDTGTGGTASSTLESDIAQIRSWYYSPGETDWKNTLPYGTNGWNYTREYYFHDGSLYFVFMYAGTDDEHRLYFKDGRMIRYIDENGTVYDNNLGRFQEWESNAVQEASQMTASGLLSYGSRVDIESDIAQIREWYYHPGGLDKKVVLASGTNNWDYTREYYYHDGELCFAFIFQGADHENRLYFKNGSMIRYIDEGKAIHDAGSLEPYREMEIKVLTEARHYAP